MADVVQIIAVLVIAGVQAVVVQLCCKSASNSARRLLPPAYPSSFRTDRSAASLSWCAAKHGGAGLQTAHNHQQQRPTPPINSAPFQWRATKDAAFFTFLAARAAGLCGSYGSLPHPCAVWIQAPLLLHNRLIFCFQQN